MNRLPIAQPPCGRSPRGLGVLVGLLVCCLPQAVSRGEEYGSRVRDYLNYRPHATNPDLAESILQWGQEQGVPGLAGGTPAEREARRAAVHERIVELFVRDAVVPEQAPDVGVRVESGAIQVVMFGPAGDVEDNEGNVAKIGYERFGHYMWPAICKTQNGQLLVRVYVGGEDDRYGKPSEWLHFLSGDGGSHWTFVAVHDKLAQMASQGDEQPITEVAYRMTDGEELRFRPRTVDVELASPGFRRIPVKIPGNYCRLKDLPKDQQWFPRFHRAPGNEAWTEDRSYWDPETLVQFFLTQVGDGEQTRTVARLAPLGYPWSGEDSQIAELQDGSLLLTTDTSDAMRPLSDLRSDESVSQESLNYVWKSADRGRSWKYWCSIPKIQPGPWFVGWRAHLEPRIDDHNWTAIYRTRGIYSGAGPMYMSHSQDQGRTWSEPKAARPCSSGIMPGLVLQNGVAVRVYGRPGVFLMFCADGQGKTWGSDVTLIKPWKSQHDALSCNNPHMIATGPDRFMLAYSRFDMPDPWGKPRLAVVTQEFVVKKL